MCNLFKVTERDGTVKYVTGTVRTGMDGNVILPYIGSSLMGTDHLAVALDNIRADVEYLGMLHSHPSRSNPANDNHNFSWGDGLAAAHSGKIYLTTPHGNVYALEGKDGIDLIGPGMKRDRIVTKYNKLAGREVSKDEWPDWVLEGMAPGGFKEQHDAKSKGSNFVTFGINTYDTRK